jgi:hypothetical protein
MFESDSGSDRYDPQAFAIPSFFANPPFPCQGLIGHQLGGAVRRIGRDETAFNHGI